MTFSAVDLVGYLFLCFSCRFFVVNFAIVYFYFSIFQRVNEEEFGGISEIMKEGLMTSFATFIVRISHTALNCELLFDLILLQPKKLLFTNTTFLVTVYIWS